MNLLKRLKEEYSEHDFGVIDVRMNDNFVGYKRLLLDGRPVSLILLEGWFDDLAKGAEDKDKIAEEIYSKIKEDIDSYLRSD